MTTWTTTAKCMGSRAFLLLAILGLAVAVGAQPERDDRNLVVRDDESRPEEQLTVPILGRPLVIGGELEWKAELESDFALDPEEDDDVLTFEPKLEVELFYPVSRDVSLFAEGKLLFDWRVAAEDGDRSSQVALERGETWLHWDRIGGSPFALQVGRQNFKDKREWWWDEDLDAVSLWFEQAPFEARLSVAQDLSRRRSDDDRIDPGRDDVLFVLGEASWQWRERQKLELFAAHRSDHSRTESVGELVRAEREDERDARLSWLGVRGRGRTKIDDVGRFYYWADAATVFGRETELDFDSVAGPGDLRIVDERVTRSVRGYALDGGVTWDPGSRGGPTLTLGYAWGSGDDGGGLDGAFRQTGLQDNNARFRGVDRFRFYGELFRPELSNLHVATLSVGVPFWTQSSLELLYHHYRQDDAAPFLRDSALDARPRGRSRSLGQELDLVVGIEESEHWEFEFVASAFRAGSAFGPDDGRWAHFGAIKVDYNF